HFVSLLTELAPERYELTDAAHAAALLYEHNDAVEALSRARIGRLMRARGLEPEIHFAAQHDCFGVVPKLVDGVLRPV
ncbi:MAG: 2-phosphosulfolactate phosphatase, partial [Sulfurifustaceae bacterium]